MSWEFLLMSFVVVLLPGTGVIYTLAVGLIRRPGVLQWIRRAFAGAFGFLGARLATSE
ncbi:hypothetical protein [Halomonas sp. M20]|uniref:hypothetical protein n=1 Tax=Halomonas sp. M20 TaxID=2763264 RepID=UPI001D09FD38|nr:hypothetical protein [Halomonas sp. M20]